MKHEARLPQKHFMFRLFHSHKYLTLFFQVCHSFGLNIVYTSLSDHRHCEQLMTSLILLSSHLLLLYLIFQENIKSEVEKKFNFP